MSVMELQLGLAIPSNSRTGVDLNCWGFDQTDRNCCKKIKKKRRFDEAFVESGAENEVEVIQTLPLLVWDKNPHDRDEENEDTNSTNTIREDREEEEEEEGVVGWPPINSSRMKLCHRSRRSCSVNYVTVENGGGGRRRGSNNSQYVKVKMEGVGIARKIDLTAHHSYRTLTNTLIALFGRSEEVVEAYKLTYQDKEGDWLLAGDVPWGTFTQSVQRLKLVKREE